MSNPLIFSGATRNRHFDLSGCISYRYIFKKEVISRDCSTKFLHCFALFLNKLYLYHDVSPLNKIFTALHRSTSVCILGTISECKDTTNIRISNIILLFVL